MLAGICFDLDAGANGGGQDANAILAQDIGPLAEQLGKETQAITNHGDASCSRHDAAVRLDGFASVSCPEHEQAIDDFIDANNAANEPRLAARPVTVA
jgi:hypothetical protein